MKQGMKFFSMAILVVLLGACTANNDLYDPAKAEALVKGQYKKNFVKEFGEVPSDYSWDATSANPRYGAVTRGEVNHEPTLGDFYDVSSETLGWLRKWLPGGKDNRGKGFPFLMTVPDNVFTIIPIFQGFGVYDWELHMVAGGNDIKLWGRNSGIRVDRGEGWKDLEDFRSFHHPFPHTSDDNHIQGRKYICDLTDIAGQPMYFYLKRTVLGNLSSLEHMMLALKCPRPQNISEDKEVMIVGCEDSKIGDGDMNELVFMIVANKVPDPIDFQTGQLVESITKRYMIEDLGSTCDFDFNDIVVDVTQEQVKKFKIVNGVIDESQPESVGPITQKAIIRHLGGVLPFRLRIGETDLGVMEGQLGANPDSVFEIKEWHPEKNDITVKVGLEESDGAYTVEFPGDGEIPMIIAVDPEVQWMEEKKSITKEWFEDLQKK